MPAGLKSESVASNDLETQPLSSAPGSEDHELWLCCP